MSASSLLRLAGLTAVLGAVLLVTVDLARLVLFASSGVASDVATAALYVRFGFELLGRALVMLGLVGLYVRQSGATGGFGLVGFLAAFFGMALPAGLGWAAVLTGLGWVMFGIASFGARIYPRGAAVLLILGTVVGVVFDRLLVAPVNAPGSALIYVGIGAEIVLGVAVGWLGYFLFSERASQSSAATPERG